VAGRRRGGFGCPDKKISCVGEEGPMEAPQVISRNVGTNIKRIAGAAARAPRPPGTGPSGRGTRRCKGQLCRLDRQHGGPSSSGDQPCEPEHIGQFPTGRDPVKSAGKAEAEDLAASWQRDATVEASRWRMNAFDSQPPAEKRRGRRPGPCDENQGGIGSAFQGASGLPDTSVASGQPAGCEDVEPEEAEGTSPEQASEFAVD
jgi:hypothetical protein